MGQAFSLATPTAGSAGIDVPEMMDFDYDKSMGNAQFMKSIRARHGEDVVLIKALVKPYSMSLQKYSQEIIRQRKALADVPNALAFQRVIETETNGYLVRPFLYNSLYDRLSTRPFLEDIEKKWLAFQLLCALRDCHARDICHGDIKAQNVLVTSWNWLYLADFSSAYKPTMLPDDNPADFSYFFDTAGKRTCYVAPERFMGAGEAADEDTKLKPAMDIFSVGCLIAQLFLETELFTLSQLYKYRRGEHDPAITALSIIADKDVREMIAHMIQLDPEARYSADKYLEMFRGRVFPEYFYTFLHQYMQMMTDISPPPNTGNYIVPKKSGNRHLCEPDERIDHVFNDFDKITYFLGNGPPPNEEAEGKNSLSACRNRTSRLGLDLFPVHLNVAGRDHVVTPSMEPPEDDGTLIFLNLVVSSLRNTARAASKIRACDIMLAFAEKLTDESKLDRVLPYMMTLLTDECDMVTIAALRSVTQLMQMVHTITPINSHIFVEYIIPRIHAVIKGTKTAFGRRRPPASPLVRATYASCIGSLATSASRFLELAATLHADGATASTTDPEVESGNDDEQAAVDELFDNAQRQLYGVFEMHTKILVEDPDVYVRRAFLMSVPALCLFFGPLEANDILLTHLNTYLNDRDWMLKCAFFDTVVGISTLIGASSLEQFLLPLLTQALADAEEFVIQSAIHAFAQLASLGLLSRPKLWEMLDIISRYSMHPNLWIRQASAQFVASACKFLSFADVRCIVSPILEPFMKVYTLPQLAEIELLDLLKKPLSRQVFEQAVSWALNTERGLFWKPLKQLSSFSFNALSSQTGKVSPGIPRTLASVQRNEEDEQWVSKLRNLGLSAEDEFKLLALREFIWRFARTRARALVSLSTTSSPVLGQQSISSPSRTPIKHQNMIHLGALGITPQTVLFEDQSQSLDTPTSPVATLKSPYTIADALMDASSTIDEGGLKKGKSTGGPSRSASHTRQVSRDDSIGPRPRKVSRDDSVGPSSTRPAVHDNSDAASITSNRQSLKPKPSVLTLLDRRDNNKTVAETGMSEANAFGEMEGPFVASTPGQTSVGDGTPAEAGMSPRETATLKIDHTYEGTDPSVLKMLNAVFLQNYPYDVTDFGKPVTGVAMRKGIHIAGRLGSRWRPGNRLVAMLSEHSAAVNRVVVAPDHSFFITASDDGSAKIWDARRLERSISQRSRQTYRHAHNVAITALCFVENTHCFVTCASDGSVHVVAADVAAGSNSLRYGRLRKVRHYQLPEGERAMWCEHFKQERHDGSAHASVLVLATNRSRIVALDLRMMTLLYVLDNPVHHGTPTCFVIDRKRHWLALGTSHGVIDLWDLRFRMRLKAWGVPGKAAIYRLAIHPTKGSGRWICVAGGTGLGEITTWDLEKTTCREIYRVAGSPAAGGAKDVPTAGLVRGYEAWAVDDDKPEGMLGRFATAIEPSASGSADRGVRAMFVGAGLSSEGRDIKHAFILTGGSDKRLRFWDLGLIENSCVYSGLGPDEGRPRYAMAPAGPGVLVNTERAGRTGDDGRRREGKGKVARSTVISQEQQFLLSSHLDCIMDVALLEVPYTMSVSADRSGVVYVFA
ncbi:hypothetical protein TD95_003144 [Thielaviopsis punctulata]|uniref:non-specific serine/threonine protein kinase n=1 Tax=Thielaviopsis punctulata TaxID=72032 RepID=A0A0F4ZAI2_9PEZI|nr:hypothetical protein TD95_003144 [Thielaviopsis punctulata]